MASTCKYTFKPLGELKICCFRTKNSLFFLSFAEKVGWGSKKKGDMYHAGSYLGFGYCILVGCFSSNSTEIELASCMTANPGHTHQDNNKLCNAMRSIN